MFIFSYKLSFKCSHDFFLGKPPNKKMSQKVEKVHMFWTFLNLGKIGNLMAPPPSSDLIWEKFEILGTPIRKKT